MGGGGLAEGRRQRAARIAEIARDQKIQNLATDQHRGHGSEVGSFGMGLCKPFAILVKAEGEGWVRIVEVAVIAPTSDHAPAALRASG